MVSVQSPPGRRELPYTRVLLPPAIVMAAVAGAAVALVAEPARIAVGVCGAVATLLVIATAAEAVRRGRVLRDARAEHERHRAYLEARIAAHDTETQHFTQQVVPAALDHLHRGNDPAEVLRDLPRLDPAWRDLPKYQTELLSTMLRIIDEEENLRDSSQRSFVSIARRVQAIVHQQAKELREMEEDHGRNPEVFDDLLRIDHGTALIGRLADSISVLGGGRPGRQWPKPVALYSVLRGAMSRILEYRRIDLKSIAKVNIKGIYVEPVIHAAAELLDNATRYSPPTSKVSVTATEVQTGVAIEIEDAGVNLDEQARARIEDILERAQRGVDLQEIGANPRLGLAVVGRLCTQFNMQVSLRASAYGGVRAVLVVPSEMITDQPGVGLAHGIGATAVPRPVDALPGPKRTPKKRRPTSPRIPDTVALEDDVPEVTEWTPGGLPQRRSRVKTPLAQRYAEQAAVERAEREARERGEEYHDIWAAAEPEKKKQNDREPGLWVDAFWEGLKKDLDPGVHPTDFTRNPTAYLHLINEPARTEADDEGDLK
ncbi:sensor histidine kinase [Streptomyces griseomycini]|uniref:histidine kinase n=1 Tax=Streptomyces griseomycini TaxID=66895 RepID=A0A7W7PSZ9_9ACTN|nr:sensor histidine kinase [Streptomyces griseomycini]MBB4900724.1 signal transduction histidine kinase [Streptomyces griseomycini]GGQ00556.1 ATPase [Streptomyces griseomycini]GGR10125.1 ATPase [Streptomyces griseomycini]